MLNLIKLKLKNKKLTQYNSQINSEKKIFKNKETIRNWKNSFYTFNKNTLIFIPEITKYSYKLIKGYFNFTLLKKFRNNLKSLKNSSNKIFLSEGEYKHTNDYVNITIFLYNRKFKNYTNLNKFFNTKKQKIKYTKIFYLIKKTGNKYKNKYIKLQKFILFNLYNNFNDLNFKNLKNIRNFPAETPGGQQGFGANLYYKDYIKLCLKIFILHLYLLQLIYINNSKFKYLFISKLINLLKILYNKNIKLNFINLKYFYLNSEILMQVLDFKLRNKRQNYLKYIKIILKKTKIKKKFFPGREPSRESELPARVKINSKYKFSLKLKNLNPYLLTAQNKGGIKNITDLYLNELFKQKSLPQTPIIAYPDKDKNLKKIILTNIQLKKISGIRLKAKGRLTRRHTASRSLSVMKTKGSLTNINSYYGYSSSTLLGYQKSNLDYTKLNSKTTGGSFGVKGWISASSYSSYAR